MLLKKSFIPIVLIAVLIGMTIIVPSNEVHADTYEELTRELRRVQEKAAQTARDQRKAQQELAKLQQDRNDALQTLEEITADLEANSLAMLQLRSEIVDKESEYFDAQEELAAVTKRVEDRGELIQERLRLMYKRGEVKYLDVLMESTSFSDFLDRVHYLSMIVNQDQTILEEQKADEALQAQKTEEIAVVLANLEGLYTELELKEDTLVDLRKKQEVQIASIQAQEEHWEHISEEAEALVMQLAAKEVELNEKRRKLAFSAGKLAFPLPKQYRVTSNFGTRTDPFTGAKATHNGIDYGAPKGTSILAAADGYVIAAQFVNGYGNYVIIDHGSGIWTLYAHMSKITAKKGDDVKVGDKIGEVGNTGRSTGPHLHFEVRKDQKAVDPAPYLK